MEFKTVEQVLAAWDASRVSEVSLPLGPVAALRAGGEMVALPQQMEVPLVERSRVLAEPVYVTSDGVRERAALMESAVVDMATRYTPKQVVFVLVQERAGLTPLMSRLPHVAAWFDISRAGGLDDAERYVERVLTGREELLGSEGYVSIAQRNEVLESRGERVSPAIVIVNDAAHTENNAEVARWVARGRSLGVYYLGAGSTDTQFDEDAVAVDRQESAVRSWWYCLGGECDDYVADPVEGDTEIAVEAVISAYAQWTAEQSEQAAQEEQQAACDQSEPEKSEAPAETTPATGQEPSTAPAGESAAGSGDVADTAAAPAPENAAQTTPEKSAASAETAPESTPAPAQPAPQSE